MTKPATVFFNNVARWHTHHEPTLLDIDSVFSVLAVLFDMAPNQSFRDQLTAITGIIPNQGADIADKRRIL